MCIINIENFTQQPDRYYCSYFCVCALSSLSWHRNMLRNW